MREISKIDKALTLGRFFFDPRKDIEIFGMFGPGNLGDEAMLVAAKRNLPHHRLTPWQNYTNHPLLQSLVHRRKRRHLLVAGGTLIHGGNTGWLDFVEMRSRQGVKVSFFGTGIAFTKEQILNRSVPFERWCEVLKSAEHVHLRGPFSGKLAREMCGQGDVFGDFSFLLHRESLRVSSHSDRVDTIGLNLGNCLGDQQDFERAATSIVKHLSSSYRLAFHAVVVSDVEVIHRVIRKAGLREGTYWIEQHFFDPYAFMKSIRSYRAFIGLKLHAAGLAMIAGVPSLMIGYLPKCYDFMAVLPDTDHMVLGLPMSPEYVLEKVNHVIGHPDRFIRFLEIGEIAARQRLALGEFVTDCTG